MRAHEHIGEAERVLRAAKRMDDVAHEEGFTGWSRDSLIALAQVHASLARAIQDAPGLTADEWARR